MRNRLIVLTLCFLSLNVFSQSRVRLNQVGFYPKSEKIALGFDVSETEFYVINISTTDTVFTGSLSTGKYWSQAQETVKIADFTALETAGDYIVKVGSMSSYPFKIETNAMQGVLKGTLKSFFYNRASSGDMLLDAKVAGIWTREGGHDDKSVLIHSSAVTPKWPAGRSRSYPRGWYDAGDYNKYVVNSGITTYTMLSMYEHYSTLFDTLNLNITESSNTIPDILDEALWNLRWMLSMQDGYDGGVFHKLTNLNFDGDYVMPENASGTRYVVMKSTAATLDFAAVMAQAYRVFYNYENQLPGFADSCIAASKKAWDWGTKNNILYTQPSDVNTGEYDDWSYDDEKNWAAAELYISTGNSIYYSDINKSENADIPGWQNVRTLGYLSLALYSKDLPTDENWANTKINNAASGFSNNSIGSASKMAFGYEDWMFSWGSNAIAGNIGMLLMQGYDNTGDEDYFTAAQSCLEYVLGRNATEYSFITGFGSKYPMNLHHRISLADGIVEPVPGLVVGGSNKWPSGSDEGVSYSSVTAKKYKDVYPSYSTNENAINYIIPISYLAAGAEAHHNNLKAEHIFFIQKDNGKPVGFKATEVSQIGVYPNPSSGVVNIASENKVIKVELVNAFGEVVYTTSKTVMDVSSFSKGVYILKVETDKGLSTGKIVVE